MAETKKRKTIPARGDVRPPRGDPASKTSAPVAVTSSIPTRQRLGAELDEREDFGENTFAGALEAVKGVLEKASKPEKKPGKKS